jgi:hypothetical protein
VNQETSEMCEACRKRPVAVVVKLGDEALGLCDECLAGVAGVIEDEDGA